jgi:hypothetical protein
MQDKRMHRSVSNLDRHIRCIQTRKFLIACAAIEYFYRDLLIEFGGVNEIR